ncbi:MAG: hypothetical protein AAFQ27_06440 [Pseudomonadota bacterium]
MLFSRSANSEFKMRRRNRRPISTHPFFVPSLAIWGALLAGLTVLVLPGDIINRITTVTALGVLDNFARYFFAALAALMGAACGYFTAIKWRSMVAARSGTIVDDASDQVRPIDPVAELGSDSLDAPIEEEPADEELLELDVPVDAHQFDTTDDQEVTEPIETLELGAEQEADPEPQVEVEAIDPLKDEHCKPAKDADEPFDRPLLRRKRPREKPFELVQALGDHRARQAALHKDLLDLGEFTQLSDHKQANESNGRPSKTDHAPTAIDKLRAVPPQDLSLMQMVERLAVALHERQEAARAKPQTEQAFERDAALAEALKALSLFTESGRAPQTERAENDHDPANETTGGKEAELRDALSKLHDMRGAA